MRKPRKWIAALMTLVVLFSVLPSGAFATEADGGDNSSLEEQVTTPANNPSVEDKEEQEQEQEGVINDGNVAPSEDVSTPEINSPYVVSDDTVIFNTSYLDIEVGNDVEKAEQGDVPYVLFADDGSYTIDLVEENPFFPYEVQFTYQGSTTSEWFMDENDCVVIGGHPFYVNCLVGTPTHVGFEVSGEYVPAFPEPKNFVNDPDYGIAPASLLPLQETRLTVDLTKYLPAELEEVGVNAVLTGQTIAEGAAVVWAKGYQDDNYTIADKNAKLNLSPSYGSETSIYLELIVGTADQLDTNNKRYLVTAKISPISDFLAFSAFTETGDKIDVFDQYYTIDTEGPYYRVDIGEGKWTSGPARISIALNSQFTGLSAAVYEGRYTSAESLPASGSSKEVKDIWQTTGTGAHLADYSNWNNMPEFTLVLSRSGTIAQIIDFGIYMRLDTFSLSPSSYLFADQGSSSYRNYASDYSRYDTNDYRTHLFPMRSGYPANGEYYLNLNLHNPDPTADNSSCGIKYVKKAVIGSFKTEAEASSETDIKSQLFSDAQRSGGYKADFSKGVTFTVFTTNGKVFSLTVKAVENTELPEAPDPLSIDTYFRMNGANKTDSGSYNDKYDAYVMPYDDDSYYYNGYQTVFLLDGSTAITDGTQIYPEFYVGNKVIAHLGHDGESTKKQESGKDFVSFKSGEAIHYSAVAESDEHLKNYWVTFLTKQSGAKLFVNGATNADPSHRDENNNPIREVFLDDAHGNHHDVFFANIGDAALTGLYVKLENPQSIKLDDYWQIREGTAATSLAAFDSTERTMIGDSSKTASYGYGELKNVAKVRLVPDGSGAISGTLIIGSTATKEEVKIKLTGIAGVPKITTTSVVDGVKYVPYSSVIQTNNMYASDAVKFERIAGTLPGGMRVKPNGEVYGVPQAAGTFTFTVRATYNDDPSLYDEKEFTLLIKDNTDTNVYTATDSGYTVIRPIGTNEGEYHFVLDGYKDQEFTSDGEYGYFIDLWLDGKKLTRGEDYLVKSGSTVVTIFGETMDANDNGSSSTHTIAAEFREGDKEDGTLKRAAQNYVIEGVSPKPDNPGPNPGPSNPGPSNPGPSNPGNSGNGSSGSSGKKPDTSKPSTDTGNTQQPAPETPKGIFNDVQEQNWFYDDVKWAKDNGIMVGESDDIFAPSKPISQATIVTVMARLLNIDLTQFEGEAYDDVTPGQWYTNAAIWAKQAGILPDYSTFAGTGELSRDGMAIMLVKFLKSMGVDTNVNVDDIIFEDAGLMTDAGREAFQILYHYGIFKGVGGNRMDPLASTTRAQFAALMHRIYVFIETY